MDIDKVIDKRRSIRSFKSTKKPNPKKIIEAIDAASKAPLAGNLPCIKFILVSDRKKIEELAQAATQNFISKAQYIVVLCCDKKFLEQYYYERAGMYASQEAGAAAENFLLKITDLGLASCWVGAFSDETVRRILKIPDSINVEAMFPVGYELKGAEKKLLRKPMLDRLLFFDTYKNRFMKPRRYPND